MINKGDHWASRLQDIKAKLNPSRFDPNPILYGHGTTSGGAADPSEEGAKAKGPKNDCEKQNICKIYTMRNK